MKYSVTERKATPAGGLDAVDVRVEAARPGLEAAVEAAARPGLEAAVEAAARLGGEATVEAAARLVLEKAGGGGAVGGRTGAVAAGWRGGAGGVQGM
jgi:hypothetical protein